MELCNDCEIVFIGKNCPLCEATKRIYQLEEEIESLNNDIKELEGQITLDK